MYYNDKNDLKQLAEMKELAPEGFSAWWNLDQLVGREDGAIPRKYRELIAIAVAHTTQCPYCIDVHAAAAKEVGATKQEVTEAIFLAAALRSSAAAVHGTMAMRAYDKA
ncbi:MAG: carboxymuconolactone decarboxylase family protein [Bdellovibrionota bacterium]